MTFPLSQTAEDWVDRTFDGLGVEQKLGQMLIPMLGPVGDWSDPHKEFKGVQPGAVHMLPGKKEDMPAAMARQQDYCDIPPFITGDLESGAGQAVHGTTVFPWPCSIAAAGDGELAYESGKASAVEGGAAGYHWSFGPVVDINGTRHSPIVNTRSFGDDVDRVIAFSSQVMRGIQDHGMIATAKHFPGDGYDDRDQHICTSVNPLSRDDWFRLSGRAFQAVIDAGVMAVMVGHISLPAFDPGDGSSPDTAPPSPVSRPLITGLLREQMGFEGLVVTDGLNMGGITQWADRETMLAACVNAGCDMLLFVDAPRDHALLVKAFEAGRILEERIDAAVRRILRAKAHLGLHEEAPAPVSDQATTGTVVPRKGEFETVARAIAEKALTLVRDRTGVLPLDLGPGKKVLNYHLRSLPDELNVDGVDGLLAATGVEVVRITESDTDNMPTPDTIDSFDAVIINFVFCPRWMTNCIRPSGQCMGALAGLLGLRHPKTVAISYGSPYVHHEVPAVPACINAYSPDPHTQRAVVKLLQGKIKAVGTSPVELEMG